MTGRRVIVDGVAGVVVLLAGGCGGLASRPPTAAFVSRWQRRLQVLAGP